MDYRFKVGYKFGSSSGRKHDDGDDNDGGDDDGDGDDGGDDDGDGDGDGDDVALPPPFFFAVHRTELGSSMG